VCAVRWKSKCQRRRSFEVWRISARLQCPRETRRCFPVFLLTGTRGATIFGGRGEGRCCVWACACVCVWRKHCYLGPFTFTRPWPPTALRNGLDLTTERAWCKGFPLDSAFVSFGFLIGEYWNTIFGKTSRPQTDDCNI